MVMNVVKVPSYLHRQAKSGGAFFQPTRFGFNIYELNEDDDPCCSDSCL